MLEDKYLYAKTDMVEELLKKIGPGVKAIAIAPKNMENYSLMTVDQLIERFEELTKQLANIQRMRMNWSLSNQNLLHEKKAINDWRARNIVLKSI